MATPGLITNHPGLMAAHGAPFAPTEFIGTGGKIFWVGNRSGLPAGDGSKPEYPFSTVNAALAKCVSGRGDIVYVLPNHAESISAANAWSSLVAGTKVIGLGTANSRPSFTWTAAGGTIAIAVANVLVRNCRFFTAGDIASTTALTVTVGFPVTGAGVQFVGNFIHCAVDSDQLCTDCITLSATADDFLFENNQVIGGTTGTVTSVLTTTGAVDRLQITNNRIAACGTAQLLDLSNAACIDHWIVGNIIQNKLNATTAVIKPHATTTGFVHNNLWITAAGGTAPASSGWTTYTTTYFFGTNVCVTAVSASAIASPAADS